MRRFLALFAMFVYCLVQAGCKEAPRMLSDAFPKENISSVRIFFRSLGENSSCLLEGGSTQCESLLNALYACMPAETLPEEYAPELRCSHRIVLSSADGDMTLYFDETLGMYFYATLISPQKDEAVLTYRAFAAPLGQEIASYQALASVPFRAADEPPLEIDALLRADVDPEELEKPGTEVEHETFDYAYTGDKPLYSLLTYQDKVPGLANGYLLVVAASGMKPTEGYEINIASIEENDHYYIVRVTNDAPVEGADVSDLPTYPVSAAKVDARRMMEKKIVAFVNEKGEILSLMRVSPEFLAALPSNMPPLTTPEPYEGDSPDAD